MANINLRGSAIVVSAERAGFVDQAVSDLAECIGASVAERLGDVGKRPVVLVGRETIRAAAVEHKELAGIGLDGLSDQGFVLKTVRAGGRDCVICCGGGARGDAYAVIELVKAIDKRPDGDFVEETWRREEPFFTRRGMYAHQHWAYAYPYALRSWEFEDWRAYIDLLAYLKINLFQIWSMCGILPDPLSDGDRDYLENYHKVIDYAKNRRGMEVFIGECANNTAEHDGGKPIQQREYFDVEVLKDPSDARQFQDIMDNRRNLYTVANNADGYWIIDSDPGGYDGSPMSEFVDILIGNRELIDRHTEQGVNAKLVYWMWQGWGRGIAIAERHSKVREAVEDIRDRLKEPWMLLVCNPHHIDYARELGLAHKGIFFPYGTIEHEPSQPLTRLRFDEMYDSLAHLIARVDVRSAMGNAQTPLVQLPNIFYFAEAAWNGLSPKPPDDAEVVKPLSKLLAPDAAAEIAQGWLMLKEPDAEAAFAAARKLSEVTIGGVGPLGKRYGPGVARLVSDLAMQLEAHGRARLAVDALTRLAPEAELTPILMAHFEAALKWRDVHDFHGRLGHVPDAVDIGQAWNAYRKQVALPADYLDRIKQRLLDQGHSEKVVDVFLTMLPQD